MRFETKMFDREADQPVADVKYVRGYCAVTEQDYSLVSRVLESADRTEIYLFDHYTIQSIATVYMCAFEDMHHGEVGATLALFVTPEYQNDRMVTKWTHKVITEWCKKHGIKKYQRSKHIDPHRQLIITKEV